MNTLKNILLFVIMIISFSVKSQCSYDTLSVQIAHINCFGVNSGGIDLIVPNTNASFEWSGPNSFSSNVIPVNSLEAGDYVLTISEYSIPGDISSTLICQMSDTFVVNQANDIIATYDLSDICNTDDSANVVISVTGGTPYISGELYNYQLSNSSSIQVGTNDTILNLPPDIYSLSISDINGCTPTIPQILEINTVVPMNSFMSSVGVICKDDNSGEARVFVQEGTPPYTFNWGDNITNQIDDSFSVDSFSSITGLLPETYFVEITDDMGCVIVDSIDVKSNLNICLTIYKAFSPNDDDINEFWVIENIHLYPNALFLVYDRNGNQVYRRRNYRNAEGVAFGGKDVSGKPLPSGTYYYVIDLENDDEVFKGTVTIVR